MRLLLVDDDERFLTALAALLDGLSDMEEVGRASDGVETVDMAIRLRPDVVLMDLDMPRRAGVEATRLITENVPESKVVILSGSAVVAHGAATKAAGAVGYVVKSQVVTDLPPLLEALRPRPPV
jgi:DNA-binding NarL/FixJ family response regulator